MKISNQHTSAITFLMVSLIVSSTFQSCSEDDVSPEPLASFSVSATSAEIGETLTFTNKSQHAKSYLWDFGDGNTSTAENPTYSYVTEGNYTITLTATGDGGESKAMSNITVSHPAPIASFTIGVDSIETGSPITLTNTSQNANSYKWEFGDGNSSIEENPTHSYATEGNYTITLTATGDGGVNSVSLKIKVVAPPFNIVPGESAMNISLGETWATVSDKLASNYTQYGPILISSSSGSIIVHPVESKSEGVYLYFVSSQHSLLFDESDFVFLIVLNDNFEGETEKGIKIGSSLHEVKNQYGTPVINTQYDIYEYEDIGIDFYYNENSKINKMHVYAPSNSNKRLILSSKDIIEQLQAFE